MKNRFAILLFALALAGCTNFGRLQADAAPPADEESIVVFGAQPHNYSFTLFPARESGGKIDAGRGAMASISGTPRDGYIVGKAKAGDTLALVYFYRVNESGAGVPFTGVWTCGDSRAKTFVVPRGKVIYVGDTRIGFNGTSQVVLQGDDFEAAKAYIDRAYPRLAGRLEPWPTEMKPTLIECMKDPRG
jgi:hypothetical protein